MGTIVVALALILVVGFVIRTLYRDKKAGKHSCGGSCGGCSACGVSHTTNAGSGKHYEFKR